MMSYFSLRSSKLRRWVAALTTACCSILPAAHANSNLLITEIQSDGLSDFWELTNVGTAPINLGGFKWTDSARSAAVAIAIPAGATIAAGESVIFTAAAAATFRTQWGIAASVQVFTGAGAPGLGMNDAITLYDAANTEVAYLSYAAGGFTRSNNSPSAGGHAGISAGGSSGAQSLIWDSASGTITPLYTSATGTALGTFTAPGGATNIGSPGSSGFGAVAPSIVLSLSATPAAFSESAVNPASTGTVSRTGSTTSALVVSLTSSDETEATVLATVTIAAEQTSATFSITAVNDTFPDGNQTVTLTATAAGAAAGTATLTVQDDGDVLTTRVLLTEVSSSSSATAPAAANDYWELTNFGTSAANIAGYSWHDSGRSASAAAAYALPAGSSIGAGESVIFTTMTPAAFRSWWGLASSVQVFQTLGAPGLGQNDGVSFFDNTGNPLFFFNYAAAGFSREDGSASLGGHAGPSAGAPTESQNIIWVPTSGTPTPRYTFATGANYGSFQAAVGTDRGSPGTTVAGSSVTIASSAIVEGNSGTSALVLNVTRSDTTTAFTVNYAVTGGTATSGTDYAAVTAGTLTFTAGGAATLPINITVNGDTAAESDETVIVTLSNVVNTTGTTTIGSAAGTGTITNDDPIAPLFTTQPANTSNISGSAVTLTVAVSGFPTPTIQWYQGSSGVTTTPVGTNATSFTTPALTTSTSYWARATNVGGAADSTTATVTITAGPTAINLANYVRVGRYNLPEPTRTALPAGTPSSNLLGQEASGVTYNWDTDTLFIVGDGGRSVTQVSKTGQLINTMTLALRTGAPQGTDFYDPEGITYLGGGQFVMTEERDRQLVKFTYAAGTTLARAGAQTVKLGTFDDNTGTEGLSWDPQTNSFIVLKEKNPIGVFQTGVDFAAGTATNGSPTAANSTNLFDATKLGLTDVADVFALSNLPSMSGQPQTSHLLIIGQEDARVVLVDRAGNIQSTLNLASDPGNPLNAADQQHEGITMDRAGNIYIVNENGGGSIDFPQLLVYAPATGTNRAPTAVALTNPLNSIQENSSTTAPMKVGDIVVTDDGLGSNTLSLTGADAGSFQITGGALYLKAGVVLDFETKTSYVVTINVDDPTLGATPDATVSFALSVTDQVVETPAPPALIVTEIAPWSSGNSPVVAADWFEVTNVSANPVDLTGWRVDDSGPTFATAIALNGITRIAPGESAIFIESSTSAPPATVIANFKSVWFGANVPAGLQVGTYQGAGIGLSTGGDALNLYNAAGGLHSSVTFGASGTTSPYQTFDNTAALNNTTVSRLSVAGENGAFVAANSAIEIGSPGYSAPEVLRVTEVAAWGSGNSPVAADWFEVTNVGARAANITGWKVDDSSESPAAALALGGITSIAPGESVIFIETADLASARAAFLRNWFGASPPPALQIGSYSGAGIGLSTGGDAVNLYDNANTRRVNVAFGISPGSAPFATFDNRAGLNVATLSTLSVVGMNGAFFAANSPGEIGSPGRISGRSFAGVYFGTLSNGGTFALFINDKNAGAFLGYVPGARTGYISRSVSVSDNGTFGFFTTTLGATAPASAGTPPIAAAANDTVFQGSISAGGVVSGSSTAGSIGMSALRSASGASASSAGFYQAGAAGSSAQVLAIVSPSGQAFVLTQSGTTVDAGTGTVDSAGRLAVTTASQQTISGTVSGTTKALGATVTDNRGTVTTISGLGSNASALAAQRLVNFSTRASAGPGAKVAIVGFVISGTQAKTVLVRAIGPGLRNFGVSTALPSPLVELYRGSALIASNTGWSTGTNTADIAAAATRSGAFPLTAGSADSVVLTNLQPGAYTAIVSAATAISGPVLLEVYELSGDALAQKLVNVSARAVVGTGDNTLIAGLVVSGTVPKRVLIRAAGPALTQFGVADALARPELTLRSASGTVIARNAGWSTSPDAVAIAEAAFYTGAFAFGATSLDAALMVNLAPGSYTAEVTDANNTIGSALVEVYDLP